MGKMGVTKDESRAGTHKYVDKNETNKQTRQTDKQTNRQIAKNTRQQKATHTHTERHALMCVCVSVP